MKNILIVEDDKIQCNAIVATLRNINLDFFIYTATTYSEASLLYESHDMDLFILDVDLTLTDSDKTGIDIGISLRQHRKYKLTPVIFITGIPEMIHSAVNDVHCFNYILKPYKPDDIVKAVHDINRANEIDDSNITIQDLNGVYITLAFENILYIHTEGHTQVFHTTDGTFRTRIKSLSCLSLELPNHFFQIHKSYIVNTNHIRSYDKTLRTVSVGKNLIPVGRGYKERLDLL